MEDTNSADFQWSLEPRKGAFAARRARSLLFLIEARTSRHMSQVRRAVADVTEIVPSDGPAMSYIDAFGEGFGHTVETTIAQIERSVDAWRPLVSERADVRAALIYHMAQKYSFTRRSVPGIRNALGLDTPEVAEAFLEQFGRPIDSVYAPSESVAASLARAWTGLARALESLPPFWLSFGLTFSSSVPIALMALPIMLAEIGLVWGLAFLIAVGIINQITIYYVVEATVRCGVAGRRTLFLGGLAQEFLGPVGAAGMALAIGMIAFCSAVAGYVGLADNVARAIGIPEELVALAWFLLSAWLLARGSFTLTLAVVLLLGAVTTTLLYVIVGIALMHFDVGNISLWYPRGDNGALDLRTIPFGAILSFYFGHLFISQQGKVALARDPSGRGFVRGAQYGSAAVLFTGVVWAVSVSGAVPFEALFGATGTVLAPLAAATHVSVQAIGVALTILFLGLGSMRGSSLLFNMVRERLAERASVGAYAKSHRALQARSLLPLAPVAAVFLTASWFLWLDTDAFVAPLTAAGVLATPVVVGLFPALVIEAVKRKGDVMPKWGRKWLSHPAILVLICVSSLAFIVLHGLVLWEGAVARTAAIGSGVALAGGTLWMFRNGTFARRLNIEVCFESDDAGEGALHYSLVVAGEPVSGEARARYVDWVTGVNGSFEASGLPTAIVIETPLDGAKALCLWVHRVGTAGDSTALAAAAEIEDGRGKRTLNLSANGGRIICPASGERITVQIEVQGPSQNRLR